MSPEWVQWGMLGMGAVGNLLVMAGLISKNSKTMGELTTTTQSLADTIENVGRDLHQLYDSRFDHERRITEIETAHRINHGSDQLQNRRSTDPK